MNSPFDLEAAKRGAEILFDGKPCKFVAHVPDNEPAYRVVISCVGRVYAFTEEGRYHEDGPLRLTMESRKEKTVGYRDYYCREGSQLVRSYALEGDGRFPPVWIESGENFIRWVHDTWQYDEVEI